MFCASYGGHRGYFAFNSGHFCSQVFQRLPACPACRVLAGKMSGTAEFYSTSSDEDDGLPPRVCHGVSSFSIFSHQVYLLRGMLIIIWFVVWNILYFPIKSSQLTDFQRVLKLPTAHLLLPSHEVEKSLIHFRLSLRPSNAVARGPLGAQDGNMGSRKQSKSLLLRHPAND